MLSHRILNEGVQHVVDHTDMHTQQGVYQWIHNLRKLITEGKLTNAQLVDAAFLLREIENAFDDIRKEAKKTFDLAGRVASARLLQNVNEDSDDRIKGELATGRVEEGVNTKIPPRESAEFQQLMEYLGVNETGAKILSVNWKRLGEVLTEMTANGKPMPPGLRDQVIYSCPQLLVTKHRGLDLTSHME